MGKQRPARQRARRAIPRRTYDIALTGELEGFNVTMASLSATDIIRVRSGKLTEVEMLGMVSGHCLKHDFDVEDINDLDYWIFVEILRQWSAAIREQALPQASGGS